MWTEGQNNVNYRHMLFENRKLLSLKSWNNTIHLFLCENNVFLIVLVIILPHHLSHHSRLSQKINGSHIYQVLND